MKCGLLGEKLGHSYSPQIHAYLGDYSYDLFEVALENIPTFLENQDLNGLNVTIPYKKVLLPYCTVLSPYAKRLGAVNTIICRPDKTLVGHNTDYFGFNYLIKKSRLQVSGKKVLVLGSGGASVTAVAVLEDLGAEVVTISRSGKENYGNLHRHKNASVIVNTTPVGMYPNTGISPVDLTQFPALEGVLDMIYNPARTQLLMDAEKLGLVAENGLWMLIAQAKQSAEWFTGQDISNEIIPQIHQKLRRQMENCILIGMPGCGKTTIGKLLAEKTGKTFVDADAEIVKYAGQSIPEIFAQIGESGFRAIETEILSQLGKQSALVIATGGGCVTRPENYPLLHQNGNILWLQRDIHVLPTEGRPLSLSGNLEQIFQTREPLYHAFADTIIDNNRQPEETLRIIQNMEEL